MAITAAPERTQTTVYQYLNPDGSNYCQVTRRDYAPGTNPNGRDKDCYVSPAGLEGPHPLYRVERLAGLPAETTLFIVEGEKCVHALEDSGLPAVTSKGGCKSAHETDWVPLAKFQRVCILPDNDAAGANYAMDVVTILNGLPGQREVVACNLPGLPEKGDVFDFLQDHDLNDLLAAIAEYGQPAKVSSVEVNDWPEPKPVSKVLRVVPQVQAKMLPESIGPWCFDAADRMQAPVDFMAVSAVCMLGSIIGRQLTIRPKALDSWSVKPNIWGGLVGPPAMMKSPCLKEARRFLDALDRESVEAHREAMKTYERQYIMYEGTLQGVKSKIKTAKSDIEREALANSIADPPEIPARLRNYTQDTTVEKLQELLKHNPRGLLMMRDELIGFLRGLDKPGQENSRAFFLEGWEGNGRFLVDRIGRGSSVIDGVSLSVLGCATPGGMSEYVLEALGNGEGADGLLQRFSLIAFPDQLQDFNYTDRSPNEQAARAAEQAFRLCNEIDLARIGTTTYPDSLPFLRYDAQAQLLFQDWYTELNTRCRRNDEHPAIQSHLLKFSKLVPALSLICHVADGQLGHVSETAFLRAAAWAEYAEAHARRLYESAFQDQAVNAAAILLRHIEAKELQDNFTVRDVYNKYAWTGLADQQSAFAAARELVETGHLREVRDIKSSGGRPTNRYLIHPKYKRI